ncbi:golgin subfamily A member 6-like protein 1 [Tachyglossus aculeatus]|uniref:golgin subfamily A member 6-like protein 1 n=1 Tax=Tachyglossus aculeatus TaxID=9261 RepID=UPI0018F674C7|nr:golgin subfamily A member 6-like protein 1 [Tachyglossus aculeatus]
MADRDWEVRSQERFCMCRRGRWFEHLAYTIRAREYQQILRIEEEREEDLEEEEEKVVEEEKKTMLEENVGQEKERKWKKEKVEEEVEDNEKEKNTKLGKNMEVEEGQKEREKKKDLEKEKMDWEEDSPPQVAIFCGLGTLFPRPRRICPEAGDGAKEKGKRGVLGWLGRARSWNPMPVAAQLFVNCSSGVAA